MKSLVFSLCVMFGVSILFTSCSGNSSKEENQKDSLNNENSSVMRIKDKLKQFAVVKLTYDVSKLNEKEKQIISLLIDAAKIMDELYWLQTYGNKEELMSKLKNEDEKKFVEINYGPYERLNNNEPFISGYGKKFPGANFYPHDMTKEEFESFDDKNKNSLYTLIRRDKDGKLKVVWYHEEYKEQLQKASELLKKAADLADDKGLKSYLAARAEALITDNYRPSDFIWMDMKNSKIDCVIGAIETYDDALFGYKAAYEAFVLIKDMEWSKKLERFISLLPELQKQLPVEDKYKKEKPGTESDLGVYEAVYYAGDCNAGSKTIAINLPNDEEVQLKKGARRLQLKNTMKAKFEKIVVPIANNLIVENQRNHIKFEAFFENVMFHEVAHGLGIKKTINGKGNVRDALKEQYSPLEEAKADILGLYLISKLYEMKQLTEGEIMDNYVTFVAGIFRSVRFGASSAHGKANMLIFNHLRENGAIEFSNGYFSINKDKMKKGVEDLVRTIITIQGDGDYEIAKKLISEKGIIKEELAKSLEKINKLDIPVDIVFEQGKEVLGI